MYPNIEKCADKQHLYNNLSEAALRLIENTLTCYPNKIDFTAPRYENGEPDFYGEFELIIKDDSYKPHGYELLILKWVEDYEDTGYMIETLQSIEE